MGSFPKVIGASTLCIVLLISATGQELCYSSLARAQLQDEIHTEDIVVSGNEALLIEDVEFRTNGSITVEDNATLVIRNARFISTPQDRLSIAVKNQATLNIVNSHVILHFHPSEIQIYNEALANVTNSEIVGYGYIVSRNSSKVHVRNSTMKASGLLEWCGVVTSDYSTGDIQNATLDIIAVWGYSSCSIRNSIVGRARAGGNSTVRIRNSVIETFDWVIENCTVHIWDSSLGVVGAGWSSQVYIQGSSIDRYLKAGGEGATIWLIDTYVRRMMSPKATIFIGWQLPILGIIIVPYAWVPYLQGVTILIVLIAIIAFFILVRRKTRAQESVKVGRTH